MDVNMDEVPEATTSREPENVITDENVNVFPSKFSSSRDAEVLQSVQNQSNPAFQCQESLGSTNQSNGHSNGGSQKSPGRFRPGMPVEEIERIKRRKLVQPVQKCTIPNFLLKADLPAWQSNLKTYTSGDSDSNHTPKRSSESRSPGKSSNSSTSNHAIECKTPTPSEPTTPIANPSTNYNHYQEKIKELQGQVNDVTNNLINVVNSVDVYKKVVKDLLIESTKERRKKLSMDIATESRRLGQFKLVRRGDRFEEKWHDGQALIEIEEKLKRLEKDKENVNNTLVLLRKKKTVQKKEDDRSLTRSFDSSNASLTDDGFVRPTTPREMTAQEIYEQEEILKIRRDAIKKEEIDAQLEKEALTRRKNVHYKESRRIQLEEASKYNNFIVFQQRYLLLSLLGKGGFSEVWKTYDLNENRYVACKIHHVNKEWRDDKKANYVKHAMREKDIHKSLSHPRIVSLHDLFTIDNDSFCSVLEYCGGNDLDCYLKQHHLIPEKEARSIIMQVANALKYMNTRPVPIIHYDLKPANILLQDGSATGSVKITDFGLSKQVEHSEDGQSIELTSQGAGTYWYLPPETFQNDAMISNKVDVWSVGVIFYQCLYGVRPIGHTSSQQQILQNKLVLNAKVITFPDNPKVSPDAQQFIRDCLEPNKHDRMDVFKLADHKYLKPRAHKTSLKG